MNRILTSIIFTMLSFGSTAQSLIGSWESYTITPAGDSLRQVVIFTEGYQVLSIYNVTNGEFIHTNGGEWKLAGDMLTEKVEFHSANPDYVGKQISFQILFDDRSLEIVESGVQFSRIEPEKQHELVGAWLMTASVNDGSMQARDTSRSRKTMKMIAGSRFQWIAYDTETKQFMASGGGTSTINDGVYTEHIEFFSRDNSKVGLELQFDYELVDGNWHHKGFSSKGDPIYEIWSLRK